MTTGKVAIERVGAQKRAVERISLSAYRAEFG